MSIEKRHDLSLKTKKWMYLHNLAFLCIILSWFSYNQSLKCFAINYFLSEYHLTLYSNIPLFIQIL